MLKHEIACVSAPGTDCAELTPSSELHFEVKSLGRFCESMPVVCVIASCMESYPWESLWKRQEPKGRLNPLSIRNASIFRF